MATSQEGLHDLEQLKFMNTVEELTDTMEMDISATPVTTKGEQQDMATNLDEARWVSQRSQVSRNRVSPEIG